MTAHDETADLATAFAAVARRLEPEPDVTKTVGRLVRAAITMVPGAEDAGVTLLERGRVRSVGPSSERVAKLDQVQHELCEGPCTDAAFEGDLYRSGDLNRDDRWPKFTVAATELGVVSMLAVRLYTERTVLGALNLYSGKTDAFDDDAETVAGMFAAHAAVALSGSRKQAQLVDALDTRDTIGMAKGILVERHHVDGDRAFDMLVEASQHANVKLRDVAAWLIREASGA
ncbi:GAF and ANTAR domain-containing protein [Amycolatopsis thermophila]|uniref:GAF domain-containing protein n=1 Tax=Amycolatopsis thermophila TaxID=206084 RepID=A0ABU0EZ40_9PSEU|nr:GAF and ANTAR domain-containing protein [Amycolatopsis thermophila]MDQ0380583.1 GAF domain-containing protein [Amycolatopsis thermophila]